MARAPVAKKKQNTRPPQNGESRQGRYQRTG